MSLENKLTSDKVLTISAEVYQSIHNDFSDTDKPLYVGVHKWIESIPKGLCNENGTNVLGRFIDVCPLGAKEVIEYRINICSASCNARGTQVFIAQSGIACLFGEARKAYENKIQTNQKK